MNRTGGAEDRRKSAEAEEEAREKRRLQLKSILTADAIERLRRIELVKPQKVRQIEDYLLTNGTRLAGGALITEEQLVHLLEQTSENSRSRVQFIRKQEEDDDDWDT